MLKFQADILYPVDQGPIDKGIVLTREDGRIEAIIDPKKESYAIENIRRFDGILCPGFINAHCHLELSYLKDKIREGLGLDGFIRSIQDVRFQADNEERKQAIRAADQEMFDNGIVAVGDICNDNSSFALKRQSKLYYHNFIEVFGFHPSRAEAVFTVALGLEKELIELGFPEKSISINPHAPYSVSGALFELIRNHAANINVTLTMHNQESAAENELFEKGSGAFIERYRSWNIDTSHFSPSGRSSLQSVMENFVQRTILLVHNTFSSAEDVLAIKEADLNAWWCLCPNANMYIESRISDVFLFDNNKIVLGTDSLASNHQLNIWGEMECLMKQVPNLNLAEALKWATINGAKALGIERDFGSLSAGKRPGLVNLNGDKVQRVI